MYTISSREIKRGPLTYVVSRIHDEDSSPKTPNADNYKGCAADEVARYMKEDQARYDAWQKDQWYFVGVQVEIKIDTAQKWAIAHTVARASLWGIESDSDEGYFVSVENDLIKEARADFKLTRDAMNAVQFAERA